MIFDKIENYQLYTNLSKKISKAFDFILNNDLNKMELGKHIIDGDEIFALLQEYETKSQDEGKLEKHFKYIDLQYIIKGTELIGVAPFANQTLLEENLKEDYAFYSGESSLIKIEEGEFCIFFLDDLHMPCIDYKQTAKVRKVVVKIGDYNFPL